MCINILDTSYSNEGPYASNQKTPPYKHFSNNGNGTLVIFPPRNVKFPLILIYSVFSHHQMRENHALVSHESLYPKHPSDDFNPQIPNYSKVFYTYKFFALSKFFSLNNEKHIHAKILVHILLIKSTLMPSLSPKV